MNVRWTKRASKNLGSAIAYIEQNSPMAAKKFRKEMLDKVEILEAHPNIGRTMPDSPGIRKLLVHENYHVSYRVRKNEIHIVTFRHARRKPLTRI